MSRSLMMFILCIFLCGCVTTTQSLTSAQRRILEAKELEGNFDNAYKATLQVLQDYGYTIKTSDYKGGVIQGETGRKLESGVAVNYEVTATVEQFGKNIVKERITIVRKWSIMGYAKVVEDPKLLQELYDGIQKEIFVRQNLDR